MKHLIAVIDNDVDTLEMVSFILSDAGYEVLNLTQFSGIDHLMNAKPALIILDEKLAGIPGHEICNLLKANAATNQIPVLLLSAVNNIEAIASACNADGFIAKPFDLDYLIMTIHKTIINKVAIPLLTYKRPASQEDVTEKGLGF